jgi:hypothetical protein
MPVTTANDSAVLEIWVAGDLAGRFNEVLKEALPAELLALCEAAKD